MSHYDTKVPVSIGIMSVATNIYVDYWKQMALSANEVTTPSDQIYFFVFTDQPESVESFAQGLENVYVTTFRIPSFGWPEATLLRYEIFTSRISEMNTDILMHLDSDMLFKASPWDRIKGQSMENNVCLVSHPGYWRPKRAKKLRAYIKSPTLLYQDARVMLKMGGNGAWETRRFSMAFVERKDRKNYVCGGVWFGARAAIGELMSNLKTSVSSDLNKNIIATWHDESHLNRWSRSNSHTLENPELCFDETYAQLDSLIPQIIAVKKTFKTR